MPEIILTEEQTKVVNQALGPVTVRDYAGKALGQFQPELPAALLAELKRRAASPGPRYTGAQVQARLRALQEEWDRTGGFDEAYLRQFLEKLNSADPGHMRQRGKAG
jgi:uncharacterized protein YmfQ (DUF2313 family)